MFILAPIMMLCQTTWSVIALQNFADFFQLDVASQKLTNELIIRVLHKTQHHKHSINAAMRSQKGRRSAWPHCVLP